jgi:hypothetical protein
MIRVNRFKLSVNGEFKGYWPHDDKPFHAKSEAVRDKAMFILQERLSIAFGPMKAIDLDHQNETINYIPMEAAQCHN